MECWCVSKHKSWLLILMMIHSLIVFRTQSGCIEEERKALLEIKASLIDSYVFSVDPLPSWVDDDSIGGECCDWERVNCNITTGNIKYLSLSSIMGMVEDDVIYSYLGSIMGNEQYLMRHAYVCRKRNWPLNVSLFLHFKELTSLDLSFACLDNGIVSSGLGRLSSLKKLEILDLSGNSIGNDIFLSLGALTLLRVLHLDYNKLEGYFPALALENLEILDLSYNEMEGFERVFLLKKLKILYLAFNNFNENVVTSLSALPSLKALNLGYNRLFGSFPAKELVHLINLEELFLSSNQLNDTPNIQDCTRLSRLKKLQRISLRSNNFKKSIISCLSALPSLKLLGLSYNDMGSSFPIQELSHLPQLEVLKLRGNDFNGTLPMEALASFHHLEVLDLGHNEFIGSIPSAIQELSSLRSISFTYNKLNGSLPKHGLCELKNLLELDLSGNMFDGNLPQCFNSLSSLKLLDISSNRFTGMLLPSLITNLSSLEYVDFSNNRFEGSFSLSLFSNHTNLEVVRFTCENDKLEVETEEPKGWIPMFQLKLLVLSNCNINRPKRSVVPGFLLHQYKLRELHLSHNSLVGQFPNWLIENNTILETLNLRNNSFGGAICMSLHMNANTRFLDVSGNHMIGTIPSDMQKFLPNMEYLNLSKNSLNGSIPSSIGDMNRLWALDLSDNELSRKVPKGLFTNLSSLQVLKLSKNRLHGQVLSGNLSMGNIHWLALDSNCFTGKIGNQTSKDPYIKSLDISNNFFTGMIPHWISNMGFLHELMVSNNNLEGRFPCGKTPFSFLDISQNSFSGPIPSCLNLHYMKHLHMGSNRFIGSIPDIFRNLTDILTLDIGNNFLSGRIPKFLGGLSNLRILILRKNNFSGTIPKQLCELSNVSLIDLSHNSLLGSIPRCLQNIISPINPVFIERIDVELIDSFYEYESVMIESTVYSVSTLFEIQDEVQFTTKTLSHSYKGRILDLMVGLDLSCNKLTGEIPKELGLLTQIQSLNLSHNQLSGTIPVHFSNLANIESLDLSSNGLSGKVPPQLIKLNYLSVFNVSYNNLSDRLPEMKAQFGTFTKESYQGNPLLCGPPLEKKCTATSQATDPSAKEGNDKWYDIDMVSFYGSSGATLVVFLLGFVGVLYINPYWRRRWLDLVEECMYACYYFLDDSVRKLSMLFRK